MTEELAEGLPPPYATEGGALALDLTNPEGEDYLDLWSRLPSTFRVAPSPPRCAFTLVPGIMDMGSASRPTGRKPLLTQRSTR